MPIEAREHAKGERFCGVLWAKYGLPSRRAARAAVRARRKKLENQGYEHGS
jgi:hypothetical protein